MTDEITLFFKDTDALTALVFSTTVESITVNIGDTGVTQALPSLTFTPPTGTHAPLISWTASDPTGTLTSQVALPDPLFDDNSSPTLLILPSFASVAEGIYTIEVTASSEVHLTMCDTGAPLETVYTLTI